MQMSAGERPDRVVTLNNIGCVYLRGGEYKKALEDFEKALATGTEMDSGKELGTIHSHMGEAYRNLERVDDALQHYRRALQFREELGIRVESTLRYNIAEIQLEKGQLEEAAAEFRRVVALEKRFGAPSPEVLLVLAMLEKRIGDG